MRRIISLILAALLCLAPASINALAASPAIAFTDDDGREIRLSAPAARVISLYSAHTENLYFLGAGNALIGAHSTSTFPPEAAALPRYDYQGDPESVIAASPDLVLIRPFISKKVPDFVAALTKAGIPVVSLYPEKLSQFDDYIQKLALLTGTEENAEALLGGFHARLDAIQNQTAAFEPKTHVFFESTETELRTVTADSMAGMAIQFAGGENVAADAPAVSEGSSIAAFGAEKILEKADMIDVYVSQRGAMNAGGDEHAIAIRPGFSAVKAVKEGRVYLINEKLVSSPSFRFVTGVEELARHFYPDQMDSLASYETDMPATKRDFANIVYRARRMTTFVPSSSSYYDTPRDSHTYGWFTDVSWQDTDFDAVETCVQAGFIGYDGDKYGPDGPVTREQLARTVFLIGNFSSMEPHLEIADIEDCENPRIVQALVDNGVFELSDDKFEPGRTVTCAEIVKALDLVDEQ